MLTKSVLTAAAIALVASLGSVVAAERFDTLTGVTAEVLNDAEKASTVGAKFSFDSGLGRGCVAGCGDGPWGSGLDTGDGAPVSGSFPGGGQGVNP